MTCCILTQHYSDPFTRCVHVKLNTQKILMYVRQRIFFPDLLLVDNVFDPPGTVIAKTAQIQSIYFFLNKELTLS